MRSPVTGFTPLCITSSSTFMLLVGFTAYMGMRLPQICMSTQPHGAQSRASSKVAPVTFMKRSVPILSLKSAG